MEPRTPLGRPGAGLRSQVRGENVNRAGDGNTNTPASSILRERATIVGMVEDAEVDCGAAGLVANGVEAAEEGLSGRRWT